MIKKVEKSEETYVQFTDEEIKELGMKAGDKFSVKVFDDGSIQLTPFKTMEIDLSELSREVLEYLIKDSCEQDKSVNEVITDILKSILKTYEEETETEQKIEKFDTKEGAEDVKDTKKPNIRYWITSYWDDGRTCKTEDNIIVEWYRGVDKQIHEVPTEFAQQYWREITKEEYEFTKKTPS